MKNYKLYIIISSVFVLSYLIFSFVAIKVLSEQNTMSILENEIQASKKRVKEMSEIGSEVLGKGLKRQDFTDAIQKSIEGMGDENIFLSIIDWSGKIVCYPDITKVGNNSSKKNSLISNMQEKISIKEIYDSVDAFDIKNDSINYSKIIDLNAIANSDLIISTHLNLKNLQVKMNNFQQNALNVFLILGLLILITLLGITRYLTGYYYEAIKSHSMRLEDGMLNLSKLNSSLENYQKNISLVKEEQDQNEIDALEKVDDKEIKEFTKKRLLTYIRNELVPVAIEDISYIYLENTITYIVRKDGKRNTANESLDQIYSSLDKKLFFRANRQIIVSIYAIDKIIKFGNSSLKIETKPASEIDIVIGKNKAASFKQWLDM